MAPNQSHDDEKFINHDSSEEEDCSYAMQLTSSLVFPRAMDAAIQLDLLEILSKAGPGAHLSANEIAAQLPTNRNPRAHEMVDRILSLLTSHSVLTCSNAVSQDGDGGGGGSHVQRLYGLAPVARYFIRDEQSLSRGHCMKLFHDKAFMDSWDVLKDALLEGEIPFNKAHGMHALEYPAVDPMFNQLFNNAMTAVTKLVIDSVLQKYKGFESLNVLVDVGGGLGLALKLITSKYPDIKGINFDLPHVIQHAPPYPGVQHIHGDMFAEVPKGEAILLKGILHDWDGDHCLKLLRNCYAALPDNGKVIVIEINVPEIIDNSAATKFTLRMDVAMMIQTPDGKERTKRQYESSNKSGFKGVNYECSVCNYWVMEFYK